MEVCKSNKVMTPDNGEPGILETLNFLNEIKFGNLGDNLLKIMIFLHFKACFAFSERLNFSLGELKFFGIWNHGQIDLSVRVWHQSW